MDAVKAVAIAKDVLKQLKLKKLRVQTGHYFHGHLPTNRVFSDTEQVQDFLPIIRESCEVCAKGAAILSYAGLYDNLTFKDLSLREPLLKVWGQRLAGSGNMAELIEIFGEDNWNRIEEAFESSGIARLGTFDKANKSDMVWILESYAYAYPEPEDRMAAIYKNVVRNKGIFKPTWQGLKPKKKLTKGERKMSIDWSKIKTGDHTQETIETRCGLPVRIYATDHSGDYPVHGAVYKGDGWTWVHWVSSGDHFQDGTVQSLYDLVMKKKKFKREVWVNFYPDYPEGHFCTFHVSKETADQDKDRVACKHLVFEVEEGEGL
jgi:hypothetical protein